MTFQLQVDKNSFQLHIMFMGMNPLKDGAGSRSKESIKEVRHVYLDLDKDAKAALATVRDSRDVPSPNFVLDTSPAKHQIVWKVSISGRRSRCSIHSPIISEVTRRRLTPHASFACQDS